MAAGVAVAVMNGIDTENQGLQYLMQPVISWQTRLEQTLANLPRPAAGSSIQRYAALLLLSKEL